jgi:hypothetical protein
MFNFENMCTLGGQLKRGLQSLGYTSSTDTITEVTASGYFNDYREYMTRGDVILFIDTTNKKFYYIRVSLLPLSGDVTTEIITQDVDLSDYLTISYNTSIADVSYSGKDITRTAGENVAFGNVAYLKSDGKLWKTDADAEATSKGMLALAVATIAGDASGKFLTQGIARNDAWNWTVGGTLYLSTDAGDLTQTAPSGDEDIVRIVGHAITADIIYFNPSNEYMELEVA